MEPTPLDSPLSLQPFDPETFQRVWNRVMPDQTYSPIVAEPSTSRTIAAQTAAAAPRNSPSMCLSEGSLCYRDILQDQIAQTHTILRSIQRLSRRSNPRAARMLTGLTSGLQRELRRLSAAYFLITGERYLFQPTDTALPESLDNALRALFQQFSLRAIQSKTAAQEMTDPCLRQLFLDSEEFAEYTAARLRTFLEAML